MVTALRVLVLAGGCSPEREVSLDSGKCVADALRGEGCLVSEADPATTDISRLSFRDWDIAFPVVHGTGGEDGVLQQALLNASIPYVGSSPEASALTFDKPRTRERLAGTEVCVPPGFVVSDADRDSETQARIVEFGLPIVVKPACQGSSVGITIVRELSGVAAALRTAFQFGSKCLVERYISGREVTVPIVDGRIFPAIEIVVAEQWYDYRAKYADDRTQYRISPDDLPAQLDAITLTACNACGVEGIARADFRVDDCNIPWLLEINTVPGMTSHSLVPKSAAALGLTPGRLCLGSIRHRLELRK
ncbi:MAG: D-alanine--D-alanine ligase [Planctomycetaceae bacterium]